MNSKRPPPPSVWRRLGRPSTDHMHLWDTQAPWTFFVCHCPVLGDAFAGCDIQRPTRFTLSLHSALLTKQLVTFHQPQIKAHSLLLSCAWEPFHASPAGWLQHQLQHRSAMACFAPTNSTRQTPRQLPFGSRQTPSSMATNLMVRMEQPLEPRILFPVGSFHRSSPWHLPVLLPTANSQQSRRVANGHPLQRTSPCAFLHADIVSVQRRITEYSD